MSESRKPKFVNEQPIEIAKRLAGLKDSAFKDYVAARLLYLNNALQQATILANTCIEKELKAVLYALNVTDITHHDCFKILHLLRQHDRETFELINKDYVKVLTEVYKSRYHEGLNPGYNFVINRRKLLAELDYTYSLLEKKVRYNIKSLDGVTMPTAYEEGITNKDPRIITENYLLLGLTKDDFLKSEDCVMEFRMAFNHEVLEALYTIDGRGDSGGFIFSGITMTEENPQSFRFSQGPIKRMIHFSRNGIPLKGR